MGRYINPDEPMSDVDKEFLKGRSRGDEVIENERRFPPDGEAAPHEAAGFMPTKIGYDYEKQAQKVEDAGGLEVQRIPTDEQGRPMVEEYGYVEGTFHVDDLPADDDDDEVEVVDDETPADTDENGEPIPNGDNGADDDSEPDDLDDDILEQVLAFDTVDELKAELKKHKQPVSGNKDELIDRLANALQDERDEQNKDE